MTAVESNSSNAPKNDPPVPAVRPHKTSSAVVVAGQVEGVFRAARTIELAPAGQEHVPVYGFTSRHVPGMQSAVAESRKNEPAHAAVGDATGGWQKIADPPPVFAAQIV
jgi:hypothetical protein